MTNVSEPFGKSIGSVLAPDGVYEGTLIGNKVRFARDNSHYEFEINNRINESKNVKIIISLTRGTIYLK